MARPVPTLLNPNVSIRDGKPVPALRVDCALSNYILLGSRSYCRVHAIDACPFGVETYPTRRRMPWWQRVMWYAKGYG